MSRWDGEDVITAFSLFAGICKVVREDVRQVKVVAASGRLHGGRKCARVGAATS